MERRLTTEEAMTIEVLHVRGVPKRAIGRALGVDEKAVRYRLLHPRRPGQPDGRAKTHRAEPPAAVIEAWTGPQLAAGEAVNLALMYAWLCAEHGYPGTLRSLERYVRARYPRPRIRARRRIETPPDAQAQGGLGGVSARADRWRRDRPARVPPLAVALAPLGGDLVGAAGPAGLAVGAQRCVRAARRCPGESADRQPEDGGDLGRGSVGGLHPAYRAYARAVGFHVDAARPRAPRDTKDVIKSGGEWISSIEIESTASRHPEVDSCAVIAIPHVTRGERPLLIVKKRPGMVVDQQALRDFLKDRIASWSMPEKVEFVADIPLGATGRIDKKVLSGRFQA
jgi:hypothetical protein